MLVRIGSLAEQISRRALTARFLFSRVLIPMAVMSVYFVLSSFLLPAGVSKVFATRSAGYLVPITIVLGIAFLLPARLRRIKLHVSATPGEGLSAGDLTLVLLPLSPVTQYVLRNAGSLSVLDSIVVVCVFGLMAALLVLAVPIPFGKTGSTRPVMYLGMAFAFSLTNMPALASQFGWHEWGSLKIQLPIFGGVWLLSWLLFRLNLRAVLHLMIAAAFLANALAQLSSPDRPDPADDLAESRNGLAPLIGTRRPVVTPSVYLLVYESYVGSETMAAYGIDNRPHEQALEEMGFEIYPKTYSVAAGTLKTMSRVLNASPVYILDRDGRTAVSGAGMVPQLLRGFGYRTYGVFPSDYFFRGTTPSWDDWFPPSSSSAGILISAVLEGEFRAEIGFDRISRDQYVQEKRRVFAHSTDTPVFLYTHSQLPGHSQTTCGANETDLYGADVAKANSEMQRDIEIILENDPEAIVIVAGDHGPRLTKNCTGTGDAYEISEISRLDIQDRYGTFLAIRWPSAGFEEYDEITVLQDLFPAVLSYMFADPDLLQLRTDPTTTDGGTISGAQVKDGVIVGGMDDGEPLFLGDIRQ